MGRPINLEKKTFSDDESAIFNNHCSKCGNVTYISLFVHQKEAIIILSQEIKGSLYVFGDVRNMCDFFGFIVVAKLIRSGEVDTNDLPTVIVNEDCTTGAVAIAVTTINTSVGQVLFSTGRKVPSKTYKNMFPIIGVGVGESFTRVKVLQTQG